MKKREFHQRVEGCMGRTGLVDSSNKNNAFTRIKYCFSLLDFNSFMQNQIKLLLYCLNDPNTPKQL